MANGTAPKAVKGAQTWNGGTKKIAISSVFLKPVAVTQDNLGMILEAGWATKQQVCAGVDAAKAPKACK